jgi:hypothetical protein
VFFPDDSSSYTLDAAGSTCTLNNGFIQEEEEGEEGGKKSFRDDDETDDRFDVSLSLLSHDKLYRQSVSSSHNSLRDSSGDIVSFLPASASSSNRQSNATSHHMVDGDKITVRKMARMADEESEDECARNNNFANRMQQLEGLHDGGEDSVLQRSFSLDDDNALNANIEPIYD